MGRCFLVARGIVLGSCFLSLFLSSFRSCFLPPFLPFFLSFFLSFLLSFYALQTQKTHALHIIIHVAAPAIFKSPPDHPSRTMTSQQKVTEDVDMEPCAHGQAGDKSQTEASGDKRKERASEDTEMHNEAEERTAPMATLNNWHWYCFNQQCAAIHTGSYPWVKKRVSPGRWRYVCLNCAPLYP